jgi:peptidoglycan/xylan/chitin deacetylase (PgdA/CDA1 family)
LSQLCEARLAGDDCNDAVVLTFDDGYLDNLTNAWPLLMEFGCPATFYVTTEHLDSTCGAYWWDILERVLLGSHLAATIQLQIDGRWQTYQTQDPPARRRSHDELWVVLRRARPELRDTLLQQLSDAAGLDRTVLGDHRPMKSHEIRELASQTGVDIGAHTVHHLSLSDLSGQELCREVTESRMHLEQLLQKPVTSFAYPYGDVSCAAIATVEAAGFSSGVTVESRSLLAGDSLLSLPRREAPRGNVVEFAEWLSNDRLSVDC